MTLRLGWRLLIVPAVLAVSFVVGILLVNVIMGLLVGRGDVVVAPDLRGLELEEARRLAREHDLSVQVDGEKHSLACPAGAVESQRPVPGRKVKRHRPIRVAVSLGPRVAAVPALRGIDISRAGVLLERQGLVVGEVARSRAGSRREGTVLTSNPRAGSVVPQGTEVSLLVSSGAEARAYVMPEFGGMNEETAREWISLMGLVPRVTRVVGGGQEQGIIFDQNPRPGERVEEGETVELTVARW